MTKRTLGVALLIVLAMLATACGGSDDESGTDTGDTSSDDDPSDDADPGDDGAGADGSGDDGGGDDGPDDDGGDQPDDDDAAEILGDPDLDLEDLPEGVADALDGIDDVVSIGECQSDVLGIGFTAPDGWQCRVLDQSVGGLDGFTLFTEGNQLNITVGTPSPIAVCEVLQACDTAVPVDLGAQWPDAQQFEIAGTVTIWASHATVDAEMVITNLSALTDDELAMIKMVADSTQEID